MSRLSHTPTLSVFQLSIFSAPCHLDHLQLTSVNIEHYPRPVTAAQQCLTFSSCNCAQHCSSRRSIMICNILPLWQSFISSFEPPNLESAGNAHNFNECHTSLKSPTGNSPVTSHHQQWLLKIGRSTNLWDFPSRVEIPALLFMVCTISFSTVFRCSTSISCLEYLTSHIPALPSRRDRCGEL